MSDVLIFCTNAGYSICSIWICFAILFSYFLKKHENKIEKSNKCFIIYLFAIMLMSIVELIYVYYFLKNGFEGKFATAFYYVYSITILISTFSAWRYVITYHLQMKYGNEDKRKTKYISFAIILLLELIIGVLTFIMPVHIFANYGIYTFESIPITLTLAFTLVSTTLFIFLLYYKNTNITKKDIVPIVSSVILICALLVFRLVTKIDINVETFQLTIFALGIFFALENQDYKLIAVAKQKQEAAQKATKSQKEFLANLSHEIRSPMNTILGYSQLLLQEDDLSKEKIENEMVNIHDASVSLLSLINNITDFSYIISEKAEVSESNYGIEQLIIELNNEIYSKIANNNVNFDYNINENVPKELKGDFSKLLKILYNILSNAISFSINGQITFDIMGNKKDNNIFEFEFYIKTEGNSLEKQSFDINSSDFMSLGYGGAVNSYTLGLLVAKSLSELLNGKLEYINEVGKESQYKLTIEQKIVNPTPIGSEIKKELSSINLKFDLTGKKILLVDNNDDNIMLFRRIIDKYNPTIEVCSSGQEAISKMTTNKYDVVFIEYIMPSLSGTQTLSRVKDLISFDTPTIALIDASETKSKTKYMEDGFYDCLQKPINYMELNRIIYQLFYMQTVEVKPATPLVEGGVIND